MSFHANEFVSVQHDIFALSQKGKKLILIAAFFVKGLMMKPKIRRVSGTSCLASVRGPSNLQLPHPQRPGWSGRGRRAGGARGPWPGRACR